MGRINKCMGITCSRRSDSITSSRKKKPLKRWPDGEDGHKAQKFSTKKILKKGAFGKSLNA